MGVGLQHLPPLPSNILEPVVANKRTISTLDLSGSSLNANNCSEISAYLPRIIGLEYLLLYHCDLLDVVLPNVQKCESLTTLRPHLYDITSVALQCIIEMKKLEKLFFNTGTLIFDSVEQQQQQIPSSSSSSAAAATASSANMESIPDSLWRELMLRSSLKIYFEYDESGRLITRLCLSSDIRKHIHDCIKTKSNKEAKILVDDDGLFTDNGM